MCKAESPSQRPVGRPDKRGHRHQEIVRWTLDKLDTEINGGRDIRDYQIETLDNGHCAHSVQSFVGQPVSNGLLHIAGQEEDTRFGVLEVTLRGLCSNQKITLSLIVEWG